MTDVIQIIHEVEIIGVSLEIKGEQLKINSWKLLSPKTLELIRTKKSEIMDVLSKDQKARQAGFLTLVSGDVYECQYDKLSHVFIFKDKSRWSAHRETWQLGKKHSIKHKVIIENSSFDMALLKASQYINFMVKGKER